MSYYDTLEVSPKASKEVIKNAYRALSKKYHPDTYKGDLKYAQEKMKEINTAYETLIDEDKRLTYDYENGFKIDPNSIVEEYAQAVREKEDVDEEEKNDKKDIFKILKEKKYLTLAGVCALFIIAVFVGNLIAGVGEKDDKDTKTTTTPVTNTTNTKNNSYIPNSNYTTNSNYQTNVDNTQNNTEDKKEEQKQEEKVEEITPQEPVGES